MAGLTDVPFRTLAWRFGAGYMVSEMVSSKPELWDTGKSRSRRVPVPGVEPAAMQIAGTEPDVMAETARRLVDDGVEVVDLNFGCPAKKVCRKNAGSALLADIDLIARIIDAVANAVDVPVTAKTRLGLEPGDHKGRAAAKVMQEAGAQMLVIHARSRACRFVGAVDYQSVADIKKQVQIPVLVNGDITDSESLTRALALSGADGAMIGRAAIGQPWLFSELAGKKSPSLAEKWQVITEHVAAMHEFYGDFTGVRVARKHMAAYAQHLPFHGVKDFQRLEAPSAQLGWMANCRERQLSDSQPLAVVTSKKQKLMNVA